MLLIKLFILSILTGGVSTAFVLDEKRKAQIEEEEQIRLRKLEEKQREILRQQEQERRRLQRIEEVRRRQEREQLEKEKQRLQKLNESIDFFIRTSSVFDSRNPLNSRYPFNNTIRNNEDIQICLQNLQSCSGYENISLLNYLQRMDCSSTTFRYDRDTNQIILTTLTPFQGADSHRVFGYFECDNCKRDWTSAGSWKNTWQECKTCNTKNYPYEQHILNNNKRDLEDDSDEERRPHQSDLCQRCQKLGRICIPSYYDTSGYF